MMAAVECQRKRKCVCSSRIVKLEEVVKELNSRLNVVEESLFGMDSMRGRMFQLEKSMENALDRIMPRLDALLGGLPATAPNAVSKYSPLFRPFPPYPGENSAPQVQSPPPSPSSKSSSLGPSRAKSAGGSTLVSCSVCHSKTSCKCSTKNVASSEVAGAKNSAAATSTRSSTPAEVVSTKNNGTSCKSVTSTLSSASDAPTELALTKNNAASDKNTAFTPVGSVASSRSSTPSDVACMKSSTTNNQKPATTPASTVPSARTSNPSEAASNRSRSANSRVRETKLASIASCAQKATASRAARKNLINRRNATITPTSGAGSVLAQKTSSAKHVPQENVPADNKSTVTSDEEDEPDEVLEKRLREAAGYGNVVVGQKLVLKGVNPKSYDSDTGDTAMHYACRGGHLGFIMMLLAIAKNTALITNKLGQTPLMVAAANGRISCVQLLVHQCDKNWSSRQLGTKALRQAASDGKEEIVRALLEGAVSPNQEENPTGPSPLHAAASNGHEIIVLMLIHKGVDISYSDSDGQTALHKAAMNGHGKCVAALLRAGANPLDKDASGWEPLHLAARAGHIECVKILLASGVDVNRPAANGDSPPPACSPKKCPDLEDVLLTANTTIRQDDEPFNSL